MTCSAVFFVSFRKYPNVDGNNKKLPRFSLEFSFVPANKTKSKSGEDVSKIIESEWFDEKSAVKTDIWVEKDHKLVCVGKYSICLKCPPFVTFILYRTKQVNYKVSSAAKNYALLLSPSNPTEAGKSQEDINLLLTKTTAARFSQEAVMTSDCS